MSSTLIPISNQPLRFKPYHEVQYCKKVDPYCFLHQPEDPIRAQFRQKPCGDNLLCNGYFTSGEWVSGLDLVTNGSFTGNANGWTLSGDVAYFSNNIKFGASSALAYQVVLVTVGKTYRVKFTVAGFTGGAVYFDLGGTGSTYNVTANGTFEVDMVAQNVNAGRLSFVSVFGSAEPCTIDTVSLREVTVGGECWVDTNAFTQSWNIADGKACHTPGTAAVLRNSTGFDAGVYYQIFIKVSGRTQGTITLLINTAIGDAISASGTFTKYITAGVPVTGFDILASIDFDGCVDFVEVFQLKNDFTFSLVDVEDVEWTVAQSSSLISYKEDYVTIAFDGFDTLKLIETIPGDPPEEKLIDVPYGCWRIKFSDDCAASYAYYCDEDPVYISNCIKYALEFPNTYLVVGHNNPDDSVRSHAFRFNFTDGFYLAQRLRIGFRKPKYPAKFERSRYSTGVNYKNYVEKDKVWELVFDYVSEIEHDAIAIQIDCKQFGFIKDGCLYEYFNITEEYAPEWDAKGIMALAQSRIEVIASGDTLTSTDVPSVDDFLQTEDGQDIESEDGDGIELED